MKDYFQDKDSDEVLLLTSYFLGISADYLLECLPIGRVENWFETLTELEKQYGIIGNRVNVHAIQKKHSTITITPENAHKMIDVVKNIAETYQYQRKLRRF